MSHARESTRKDDAFFKVDRERAALLVIDMQNAFLEEGSMLEVAAGRQIVAKLNLLISECRQLGVPVIWVQLDSSEPYGGLLLEKYPALREHRVLFKDDPSFALYRELPGPESHEYRIVKHKYDAFHDTDLDTLLRSLGLDTLIITGVTTNCCCESTARSAFERNYRVAFTSDATAAFEERLHLATLGSIRELFGRVLLVDELIEELNN